MPERTKGRPRVAEAEPRAYIRWINGRAYAELGAWAAWGGRRQEPLIQQGEKGATRAPNSAAVLFGQRLAQLRQQREMRPNGASALAPDVPTSIGAFIGYHLAAKADVKGRHRPSERELSIQRTRLMYAARFFRGKGLRDLREIEPHGDARGPRGSARAGRVAALAETELVLEVQIMAGRHGMLEWRPARRLRPHRGDELLEVGRAHPVSAP